MKRILVCGGRDYNERKTIFRQLDLLSYEHTRFILVCGYGHYPQELDGADYHAYCWAVENRFPCGNFPAAWGLRNKAAGPIRNSEMLKEMQPDLVVAFPGGRGTADMVKKARAAGVEVMEVGE